MTSVAITGAAIHPFGRHAELDPVDMAATTAMAALEDAGVAWEDVTFSVGGTAAAGLASNVAERLGPNGSMFLNVYNGCATGGSALVSASLAIRSGEHDVALVIGFDKHPRGALSRPAAFYGLPEWYAQTGLMVTTQFFGMKAQRFMHETGVSREALAAVAARALENGELNPNAWRRTPMSREEILAAPMIADPLTRNMVCSPGAGAVALVLTRADAVADERAVHLKSAEFRSRGHGTFEVFSTSFPAKVTRSPSVAAAAAALATAGVDAADVDVAQVQDTDAGSELVHLVECGLVEPAALEKLVRSGGTSLTGSLPVNTDGGCLANGEPIGASGLRQVYENVLQLRGEAGDRQVPGAQVGFSHVYGAPGISACTVVTSRE